MLISLKYTLEQFHSDPDENRCTLRFRRWVLLGPKCPDSDDRVGVYQWTDRYIKHPRYQSSTATLIRIVVDGSIVRVHNKAHGKLPAGFLVDLLIEMLADAGFNARKSTNVSRYARELKGKDMTWGYCVAATRSELAHKLSGFTVTVDATSDVAEVWHHATVSGNLGTRNILVSQDVSVYMEE